MPAAMAIRPNSFATCECEPRQPKCYPHVLPANILRELKQLLGAHRWKEEPKIVDPMLNRFAEPHRQTA